MTRESEDRFIDEIRAARPKLEPSAEEWAKGERGQRVLKGVLASAETSASTAKARAPLDRGPRWWAGFGTRPRMLIAAAVVVVAVLAVTLSVVLPGRTANTPMVAEGTSTTSAGPGTTEPGSLVTKLDAVEHVMQLDYARAQWLAQGPSIGTAPEVPAWWLEYAVAQGLIRESDVSGESAGEPMLWGEYVVLLWRVFGPYLSHETAPTTPIPENVDPAIGAAIQGLQSAGVIQAADGGFVADQPLNGETEQLLLARMEAALRGRIPQ
jgi:hypothetical protein